MRSTSRLSKMSVDSPCAAEDMMVEAKERVGPEKWLAQRVMATRMTREIKVGNRTRR